MDSTGWSAYVVGRIGWETLPAKATAGTDCSREYRSPSPGPELRKRLRRFATCSPPTPARGCSGSAPGGCSAARGSLAVPVDDEQQRAQREQQPEGDEGGEVGERSGERPGAYGDHQDAQSVAHAGPPSSGESKKWFGLLRRDGGQPQGPGDGDEPGDVDRGLAPVPHPH